MPAAPDELKWNISLVLAPNDDRVPEEIRGKPALSSSIVWFGEEAAGRRHINRIFSIGKHVACKMDTISYLTLQTMADSDFPHGRRYYTKSGYFAEFTDSVIEIMVRGPRQHSVAEYADRTSLPRRRSRTRQRLGNGFWRPQRAIYFESAGRLEGPRRRCRERLVGSEPV